MSTNVEHKDSFCTGCNQPCVAEALTPQEDGGSLCHFCSGSVSPVPTQQHMLAVKSNADGTHVAFKGPNSEARLSLTDHEVNLMVRM